MQEERRRDGDIERVDACLHRDTDAVIGFGQRLLRQSRAFMADEEQHRLVGGDPNIRIWLGLWELGPDEALLVEATPPKCDYWNFQLGNIWAESLDSRFRRVHVNNHTAELRDDGSFRLVVAHENPGVPNWIDTAGHDHGTMCVRWVRADTHPEPKCRVVKLAELGAA